MQRNRSIPPPTVVPVLVYPDVAAAAEWLSRVFGFEERTRIGEAHRVQMSIGEDGAVIVADTWRERRPPVAEVTSHLVKVRVPDVDALYERARSHGAHVIEQPTDREYGERECSFQDPGGHRWVFGQTLRDVAPEEIGCTTVAPWPRASGE